MSGQRLVVASFVVVISGRLNAWGHAGQAPAAGGTDADATPHSSLRSLIYRSQRRSAKCCCGRGRGQVEVWQKSGGRYMVLCDFVRSHHIGRYHHEALTWPALAALGKRARRVLVLGGSDGGVATQVLWSSYVQQVVLVNPLVDFMRTASAFMGRNAAGLRDPRLQLVPMPTKSWVASQTLESKIELFDLVVLDPFQDHDEFFSQEFLQHVKGLMSVRSAFVHIGTSLWNLTRLTSLYRSMSSLFQRVFALTHAATISVPWDKMSLVACQGGADLFNIDWTWWHRLDLPTVYYNPEVHAAMLVPPATVLRALGLAQPSRPDEWAVQHKDAERPPQPCDGAVNARGILERMHNKRRALLLHRSQTPFQQLEIYKQQGIVTMFLNGDLQLTDKFADVYHEALVHPAMAALGHGGGRRVLIVGGGDGGVASVVLGYDHVEAVVQVEIDGAVLEQSKRFLPGMAQGYSDPRMKLIIEDAAAWAQENKELYAQHFDLCIVDRTDEPIGPLLNHTFTAALKVMLRPWSFLVENSGEIYQWLLQERGRLRRLFKSVHTMAINSPEYPSPFFIHMATDHLDPLRVDWAWWQGKVQTSFYHPTLHQHLFSLPAAVRNLVDDIDSDDKDDHTAKMIVEAIDAVTAEQSALALGRMRRAATGMRKSEGQANATQQKMRAADEL